MESTQREKTTRQKNKSRKERNTVSTYNRSGIKLFLFSAMLLASLSIFQFVHANIEHTTTDYSTSKLSDIHLLAQKWQLSETEYQRYTDIMQGPLGHWNPDIDPVLALGIFAESEAEQQRYAELYARQEYLLIIRTQAFERVYRSAFSRLYPEAEVISAKYMAAYHAHQNRKKSPGLFSQTREQLQHNDRILYFVEPDCRECKAGIERLKTLIDTLPGLYIDFYLLDLPDEKSARRWVKENNINVDLVRQARITINLDAGTYKTLAQRTGKQTRFYLSRGDNIFAVDSKDIYF